MVIPFDGILSELRKLNNRRHSNLRFCCWSCEDKCPRWRTDMAMRRHFPSRAIADIHRKSRRQGGLPRRDIRALWRGCSVSTTDVDDNLLEQNPYGHYRGGFSTVLDDANARKE